MGIFNSWQLELTLYQEQHSSYGTAASWIEILSSLSFRSCWWLWSRHCPGSPSNILEFLRKIVYNHIVYILQLETIHTTLFFKNYMSVYFINVETDLFLSFLQNYQCYQSLPFYLDALTIPLILSLVVCFLYWSLFSKAIVSTKNNKQFGLFICLSSQTVWNLFAVIISSAHKLHSRPQ